MNDIQPEIFSQQSWAAEHEKQGNIPQFTIQLQIEGELTKNNHYWWNFGRGQSLGLQPKEKSQLLHSKKLQFHGKAFEKNLVFQGNRLHSLHIDDMNNNGTFNKVEKLNF